MSSIGGLASPNKVLHNSPSNISLTDNSSILSNFNEKISEISELNSKLINARNEISQIKIGQAANMTRPIVIPSAVRNAKSSTGPVMKKAEPQVKTEVKTEKKVEVKQNDKQDNSQPKKKNWFWNKG